MSNLLEEVKNIEEGFSSDAQRRAAFASGYKEKGKKKKDEEAVSPAQQAAIAISKKEKGEKPKDERDEGNTFGMALKSARDKGEKTFVVSGKKYNVEDLDKDDEKSIGKVVKALKKAVKAHQGQADTLTKDIQDEVDLELDEITQKFAVIDPDGNVLAFASDEKDANSLAKNNLRKVKGKVVKLKRGIATNRSSKMIGRPLEMGIAEEILDIQNESCYTLDESKMKELAMKIADVYMQMKKDSVMKPFADRFRADVKRSLDIRKSLEKVLPDYVDGAKITAMMKEEETDEAMSPKAKAAAAAKARQDKKFGPGGSYSKGADAIRKVLAKKEDVEVTEGYFDEQKSSTGYDLYHKEFSGAMQHAYAHAKKKFGITIDPDEISDKVSTGPRKPSKGKTNSYRLKGDRGSVQIQVYNMGSRYELNMYKESVDEEVEIDEAISGDQYYYVDSKGVVAAVGSKDAMRKMNMKQAKDGNKGGSFSQNLKKYKVGDKIKEETELDEKPTDFIRLTFNNPADVKKAKKWMDQNLPGADQGFTGMDASGKDIEFEDVDDAEDLMAKLKKAGFKFKVDYREEVEIDEVKKKPVSQMTPKEKAADAARRKEYKDYQKSKREEVENEELDESVKLGGMPSGLSKERVKADRDVYAQVLGIREALDPADFDISATSKDKEQADKNVILQLRKVISLNGTKPVEFSNGKKEKVHPNVASAALNIHRKLRRTDEKDAFQQKIAKSYRDLLNAVKGK